MPFLFVSRTALGCRGGCAGYVGSRDRLGQFTVSRDDRGGGNRCSGHGSMPGYTPSAASPFASQRIEPTCSAMSVVPSTFNYCRASDFPHESAESHFVRLKSSRGVTKVTSGDALIIIICYISKKK